MNDAIYRISLDIHAHGSQAVLKVKKADTGRKLVVSLRSGGTPYIITDDCYAVFKAIKPDGSILFNACTIENNKIIYEFTEQTCAAVGRCRCEIALYGLNEKLITSPRFTLLVDGTVYPDGVVESTDEFSALTALISKAQEHGKLFESAVLYDGYQPLTEAQKAQARTNIGAAEYEKTIVTEVLTQNSQYTGKIPGKGIKNESGELSNNTAWDIWYFTANKDLEMYVTDGVPTNFKIGIYKEVLAPDDITQSFTKGNNIAVYDSRDTANPQLPLPTMDSKVSVKTGNIVAFSTTDTKFKVIKEITTLRCDFVLHNESQNLTPEQQAQARANIGAMSTEENLVKYIHGGVVGESTAADLVSLRSLETGWYILEGQFLTAGGKSMALSGPTHVCVYKNDNEALSEEDKKSLLWFFTGERFRFAVLTDDSWTFDTYTLADKATEIKNTSDDEHYPTAKAVYTAINTALGNIGEALDSIIAIQNELLQSGSNENLITFTVETFYHNSADDMGTKPITYQAISGMTWAEWVESKYNTDGFYLDGGYVYNARSALTTYSDDVSPADEIVPGATYYEK